MSKLYSHYSLSIYMQALHKSCMWWSCKQRFGPVCTWRTFKSLRIFWCRCSRLAMHFNPSEGIPFISPYFTLTFHIFLRRVKTSLPSSLASIISAKAKQTLKNTYLNRKKSFIFQYVINWFYILWARRTIDQWSTAKCLQGLIRGAFNLVV